MYIKKRKMTEDKNRIAFHPSDQKVAHMIIKCCLNSMLASIRTILQSCFKHYDTENSEQLCGTWHILPSSPVTCGHM